MAGFTGFGSLWCLLPCDLFRGSCSQAGSEREEGGLARSLRALCYVGPEGHPYSLMMCPWCQCMDGTPWGQQLLCNLTTHVCSVLFPQLHADLLPEHWSQALLPNATRRGETNEREAGARALMGLSVLASGRATENEHLTTSRVIEKMTSRTNNAQNRAIQSCVHLYSASCKLFWLLPSPDCRRSSLSIPFFHLLLFQAIKRRGPVR